MVESRGGMESALPEKMEIGDNPQCQEKKVSDKLIRVRIVSLISASSGMA